MSIVLSGLLTLAMRRFALRIGATDKPDMQRKTQIEPVPYLGGVAISLSVVILSFLALFLSDFTRQNFWLASSVLLPAIALSTMGLIDDLHGLQPWPRLLFQSTTALLVSVILISTGTLGQSFGNQALDTVVTVFWIVGVCNSINFFDNLDGGASGTVAIITSALFLIAFDNGQFLVATLAIITAGSSIGFLIWNKSPAKIYMGDAGALFIGLIIAVLTIRIDPGLAPTYKSFALPLLLMAVPILDTTVAVTSRLQRGISPFTGGRDHLSHRLMREGCERRSAAFILWGMSAAFCGAALAVYRWPDALGLPLIILTGIAWISLLAWFLRIPATD